jgi:hypothetical protein
MTHVSLDEEKGGNRSLGARTSEEVKAQRFKCLVSLIILIGVLATVGIVLPFVVNIGEDESPSP